MNEPARLTSATGTPVSPDRQQRGTSGPAPGERGGDETMRRSGGILLVRQRGRACGVRPRRILASRFGRQRAEIRQRNRRYSEGKAHLAKNPKTFWTLNTARQLVPNSESEGFAAALPRWPRSGQWRAVKPVCLSVCPAVRSMTLYMVASLI